MPALVSEEVFALAQKQLEKNKHHSPRRTVEPTLLQGMLVCEQCGTMVEVPDEIFADLVRVAGTEYGFAINPHRFAVTGRCAACQAQA